MTGVLIKGGNFTETYAEGRPGKKTQAEDGHLLAKGRGLGEMPPLMALRRNYLANT